MFTGLIEQTGVLTGRSCIGGAGKLFVRPGREFDQPEFGESVAVNGVCLTLERYENGILECHKLEETQTCVGIAGEFRACVKGGSPCGRALCLRACGWHRACAWIG